MIQYELIQSGNPVHDKGRSVKKKEKKKKNKIEIVIK